MFHSLKYLLTEHSIRKSYNPKTRNSYACKVPCRRIDLNSSYVIGDRMTDVELAKNLGCKAIFIGDENVPEAVLTTNNWNEIYRYLKKIPRTAKVNRKTSETDIVVSAQS